MPNPSIAWRPLADGSDVIMIVVTGTDGSLNSYSVTAPDPVVNPENLQWSAGQIAGPGSATGTPGIAFGGFLTTHVAASGAEGIVYYLFDDFVRLGQDNTWYSQTISSSSTDTMVGIAVMPDDQVYVLTVSSSGELVGYLGSAGNSFVPATIPNSDTSRAAMAVRSISSSEIEVHIVAGQQQAQSSSVTNILTYFWSTYTKGAGFGPWQSNQVIGNTDTNPPPRGERLQAIYPGAITISPNGQVVVSGLIDSPTAPLTSLYYFIANSPGSEWSSALMAGQGVKCSFPSVAVDGNNIAHSIYMHAPAVTATIGNEQPTLQDSTLPLFTVGAPGASAIGIDAPGGSPDPDPLQWDECTWSDGYVWVGDNTEHKIDAWQPLTIAGMTVRKSGEVDAVFWNYPFTSIAFFNLPLNSSAWNFGLVG
jgi:hypothetical protein